MDFVLDSEEIGVDKVVYEESIQTTTSSGSDEYVTTESSKEEESVSLEDAPQANDVEKIGTSNVGFLGILLEIFQNFNFFSFFFLLVSPPETCDKTYDCSSDVSINQLSPSK